MVALQNEIQAMMNIGLIGCGMWGRNLARNLAQLEVLAAVADHHAENAAEFGSAFAAKPVDVDTLIHDEAIDGIVIATAAPSHDALAIAALAAGKHIFVEKPLSKIADINIPAIGTGICCLLRINVCANIVLILPHGRISKYIGELVCIVFDCVA